MIEIHRMPEFASWYLNQTPKTRVLIDGRLYRIRFEGHFGKTHRFDGLIELKWASGLRIYTHQDAPGHLMVLLGGNKNGQDKDIRQAKRILEDALIRGARS